jgi:hypothetical protein
MQLGKLAIVTFRLATAILGHFRNAALGFADSPKRES